MLKRKGNGALVASAVAVAVALAGCSAGSLGSADSGATGADGGVTINLLTDNSDQSQAIAKALAAGFHAKEPSITVNVTSRPQGTDGDNVVKTKLSTGDMDDVFMYNSGSLFQAIDPVKNLVDLSSEPSMANVEDIFKTTVTGTDGKVYGVPFGTAMGGGILYNMDVFKKLNLSVPKTWDEFMANNAKIKAAGITPVEQTYGDTWTSQLFVLGDYHNVAKADPQWAEKYTKNQAKYADGPALHGFEDTEAVVKAGYINKDAATAKLPQGLAALAKGEAAQYPMLSAVLPALLQADPSAKKRIGFYGIPGRDAASNGLTLWVAAGVYIPKTTSGAKLDAAKKLLNWIASPEGCDAITKAQEPTGPYFVKGATLPSDLAQVVTDLQTYVTEGKTTPALEFVSPVKGPNLEKILIELGTGQTTAVDAAKRYDEDVKKQAQQLGLPGW